MSAAEKELEEDLVKLELESANSKLGFEKINDGVERNVDELDCNEYKVDIC